MANGLYDAGREAFLAGDIAFDSDDVRCILIDEADDTPDLAVDDFLDDRAAASRVATSVALTGKTITDGTADATGPSPMWPSVTGDESESIDLYQHTGVETTSHLICNIDTADGLPVIPNTGDIDVTWNAAGIFTL